MSSPSNVTSASDDAGTASGGERRRGLPSAAWPWISLVLRLVLAGVFLYAGLPKLGNLKTSQMATRAYEIFPYQVADVIGVVQPILEVALGLLLLLGLFTRACAFASLVLLVIFIAGIISAWSRGLAIDCGCFTPGGAVGESQTHYPLDIARDVGFMIVAALLAWRPRSPFSLDAALWRA